jgi:hypothetical protein
MVCKKYTRVYTGSDKMSLRPVQAARVLALVCNRGYKRSREGTGSQVSGGEVSCESLSVSAFAPYGGPPFPFYKPRGKGRIHERERVERGGSPGSRCSPSLYMGPMGFVDDAGGVPAPLSSVT